MRSDRSMRSARERNVAERSSAAAIASFNMFDPGRMRSGPSARTRFANTSTNDIASATTETRTAMADLAVENALAVLSGRPPLTPVP